MSNRNIIIRGGPSISDGITFKTKDGHRIGGVLACEITILPEDIIRAKLSIIPELVELEAVPFLSSESLEEMANLYGYELRRKDEN